MPAPEIATSIVITNLFLAEPSSLSELSGWIELYIQIGSRFTFTEEEVLGSLWQEGEEIRLREDNRFREVPSIDGVAETLWQLTSHTVANQRLYDLLSDNLWDGYDLYGCLANLDQEQGDPFFHVFARADERFQLIQDEHGIYSLLLSKALPTRMLVVEEKSTLDALASRLLELAQDRKAKPWTTTELLKLLREGVNQSETLEQVIPATLEQWLLQQNEWVRVGLEGWIPRDQLPSDAPRHRYAVWPVFPTANGIKNKIGPEFVDENTLHFDTTQVQEEVAETKEAYPLRTRGSWKITLRTVHLNEGRIPVPRAARVLYPQAQKLTNKVALAGLWFEDQSHLTIWLDKTKHELSGPDLQDQFAFLEAGTILGVTWTALGIRLQVIGRDAQAAEEEERLVDLTGLAQLRSSLLESYRGSLRAILEGQNQGLSFQELYAAICQRQHHKPNRASIRSILSSSPEFAFARATGQWTLNLSTAPDEASKMIRRSVMTAHQAEGIYKVAQQAGNPPSLSEMLANNREHLRTLRDLYISDRKPDN